MVERSAAEVVLHLLPYALPFLSFVIGWSGTTAYLLWKDRRGGRGK